MAVCVRTDRVRVEAHEEVVSLLHRLLQELEVTHMCWESRKEPPRIHVYTHSINGGLFVHVNSENNGTRLIFCKCGYIYHMQKRSMLTAETWEIIYVFHRNYLFLDELL